MANVICYLRSLMLQWFAAPLTPQAYIVTTDTGCASSGAVFNAVPDELVVLKHATS